MGLHAMAIRSVGSVLKSVKSKVIKPSAQIVSKPHEMQFMRHLKGMEGKLPFTVEGNILKVDGKHFKLIPSLEKSGINRANELRLQSNVSSTEQLVTALHEVGHIKDPYLSWYLTDPKQMIRQELRAWKWASRLAIKTGWISNPEIRATLVRERRAAIVSYESKLGVWSKDNMHAAMRRAHMARLARFKYETEGVKL